MKEDDESPSADGAGVPVKDIAFSPDADLEGNNNIELFGRSESPVFDGKEVSNIQTFDDGDKEYED